MAEFDMDGAVDSLSQDLFGATDAPGAPDLPEAPDVPEPSDLPDAPETPESPETPEVTARSAPKSWAKEKHALFQGLTPEAQDYIEQREAEMHNGLEMDRTDAKLGRTMRDIMGPYRPMLQAAGIDEPKAVGALLNAHYKLSTLGPAERAQYFAGLGQQYGIDLSQIPQPAQLDPSVKALQDRLQGLEQTLSSSQQRAMTEARARTEKEIADFAAQPEHAYFNDVSDDLVAYLQAGYDLKGAYERAVWANPITRAKEVSRLQAEAEKTSREKIAAEAEAARQAASNTVKSRNTVRTPTEPKGSMKDLDASLRDTLRDIRSRTH